MHQGQSQRSNKRINKVFIKGNSPFSLKIETNSLYYKTSENWIILMIRVVILKSDDHGGDLEVGEGVQGEDNGGDDDEADGD